MHIHIVSYQIVARVITLALKLHSLVEWKATCVGLCLGNYFIARTTLIWTNDY